MIEVYCRILMVEGLRMMCEGCVGRVLPSFSHHLSLPVYLGFRSSIATAIPLSLEAGISIPVPLWSISIVVPFPFQIDIQVES